MTATAARRRGQPLALLALVVAGWAAIRVAVWEPPFAPPAPTPFGLVERETPPAAGEARRDPPALATLDRPIVLPLAAPPLAPPMLRRAPVALPLERPVASAPSRREEASAIAPGVAAGHQLLYLAAFGRLPLPASLAGRATPEPAPPVVAPVPALVRRARWSGDGWLLLRQGSGGLAAAGAFPAYGASQAGAVLRYALAPSSPRAPQAHLRLTRALGGFAEAEAAAGVSARPFAALPLRLLGEARAQRSGGRTQLRPAASLITELPPVSLPLGIEGEAYAQAGYVGGRGATGFFDAQASAERSVARAGPVDLRLGAGAGGGGQEGAARLDLGPRASVRLRIGASASRLALDWRFRVAGNARPASGPALTVSAGF